MDLKSGELAKSARVRRKMTQVVWAAQLDLTQSVISQYERGTVEPSIEVWLRMAILAGYPSNIEIWRHVGLDQNRIAEMLRLMRDANDAVVETARAHLPKRDIAELSHPECMSGPFADEPVGGYPEHLKGPSQTVEEFLARNKTTLGEGQIAGQIKPEKPAKKGKPKKRAKKLTAAQKSRKPSAT